MIFVCVKIRDALEVDDKNPDALCMLGDLELKNDDWVKAKDTFRAAKDASNGKDSYATLCLVIIITFSKKAVVILVISTIFL